MTDRLTPSVTDRLLVMYGILLQHLFDNGIFLYGRFERLFATELNNKYFTRQIF